jgi:hypothetical protein
MKRFFVFFLTTGSFLSAGESTFRTFSDSQGREMNAKLTQVSGDDVYIERRDGLSTKVNISIFSKDDQDFIRGWDRKETLRNDAIKVRSITDVEDKSGWEDKGGGIVRKTSKESYGIELTNESQLALKISESNTSSLNLTMPWLPRNEARAKCAISSHRRDNGSCPEGEKQSPRQHKEISDARNEACTWLQLGKWRQRNQ